MSDLIVRLSVQFKTRARSSVHTGRSRVIVAVMAVCALAGVTAGLLGSGAAAAAPATPHIPEIVVPTADEPVPVAPGNYSYIATHDVTKRLAAMKLPEAVASLPVPAQYRPANLALAQQFDLAVAGALKSPGGCLQIVVDPQSRSGSLFNYGFFPVAGQYCA